MPNFELRTFHVDVTPPVDMVVCGWHTPGVAIESPIELRGIILSANGTHYVMAAIDYCYMIGRSHERFERALAEGAGIPVEQATIHSDHTHDAPMMNEQAHAVIDDVYPDGPRLHDEAYFSRTLEQASIAVHDALAKPGAAVDGVAFTKHRVEKFGATRRVIDENGNCHIRWSRSNTFPQWMIDYPEGRIDPDLSMITFFERRKPIACMSFYASHPQVSCGRLTWSSDTIGVARHLFESHNPGVFPIYFTGCAGDVTAGKYTTPYLKRDQYVFGSRLFDAMQAAFEKSHPQPLESIGWVNSVNPVPLGAIPQPADYFESIIANPASTSKDRYLAALKLRRLRENIFEYPFRLSRLALNDVGALFMPTELIVDYQLYAQEMSKRQLRELAVSAYGDSMLDYTAIDISFEQGGYEVDERWTEVGPGIEQPIKDTILEIVSRGK
jgi:hypothetical protein